MNRASFSFFSIHSFLIDMDSDGDVFVLHSIRKSSVVTSPLANIVAPLFGCLFPPNAFATAVSCFEEKYRVGFIFRLSRITLGLSVFPSLLTRLLIRNNSIELFFCWVMVSLYRRLFLVDFLLNTSIQQRAVHIIISRNILV